MFRKSILALATAAILGTVALAPNSASAYWGGHHMGGFRMGFHRVWAPRPVYRPHFFAARHRFFFARHPFFVRRHFAFIEAPILLDTGCWRVHRVWTPWGLRWHRVWVCG